MKQDYMRWPESRWTASDIDWKKAQAITAGVDVGAVSSKAVVLCDDKLYTYAIIHTGSDSGGSATRAMERALEGTGMRLKDIQTVTGTGCGGKNVAFSQQTANEIVCHVQAASFMFGPTVRTVVDMGGQTSKAIKCNERGKISEFFINDKCATGMGRGIETLANLLHVPIQDMGEISLTVKEDPEPVSTTCSTFANTQAMGMLRSGAKENEILAAYLFAIAYRVYTLVGRLKVEKDVAFTGGLAKNPGVVKRLERELGLTSLSAKYDVQLAGAVGAALAARSLLEKSS